MFKNRLEKLFLRDEAQETAERKMQTVGFHRQGLSEHATQRFARKRNL